MQKEKTISATQFKAQCLSIIDELEPDGIIVTKHGRPVARVLPVASHTNRELIGSMKGRIKAQGDLFSTRVKCIIENASLITRDRRIRKSRLVPLAT